MDPSYTPSCVSQFRMVVQGISPLNWRRLLGRSDTPLVTIHTVASATARGNASARALWNRRSIRRSASGSAHASRCREPYAGRRSSGGSARACGIAIGRRQSGSGSQGSVPPRSQWRRAPRIKRSAVQTELGDAPPAGVDEHGSGLGASPGTWMVCGYRGYMAGARVDTVGRSGCSPLGLPPSGRL
jgi:hypothetical protein